MLPELNLVVEQAAIRTERQTRNNICIVKNTIERKI